MMPWIKLFLSNVETNTSDTQIASVFVKQDVGLNVETIKLKACHVCVRPLENILLEDRKPAPPMSTKAYQVVNITLVPVPETCS